MESVYLIPYLRGYCHRDMLHRVWRVIEDDQAWEQIYWESQQTPLTGDLVHFITNMHDPEDPKIIYIVVDDEARICGLVWFNRLEGKECEGNIWMAKGWRPFARQVVKQATERAFSLGYKVIHGTTPHTTVRNLLVKCGYEDLGKIEGKVWCLRMENEDGQKQSKGSEDSDIPHGRSASQSDKVDSGTDTAAHS